MIFVTINNDDVIAKTDLEQITIRSTQDLIDFCDEHDTEGCYCSSSIDWPEEYTDSQDTIKLCHQIRGLTIPYLSD